MRLAVIHGEVGQSPVRVRIMKLTSNNEPAWTVSEPPAALKGVSSTGERRGLCVLVVNSLCLPSLTAEEVKTKSGEMCYSM